MIGPEFAQLSEFVGAPAFRAASSLIYWQTREIITTHMSRSTKGTATYHTTYNSLLASHRQLRCIIFQCKADPPAHERSNDRHMNIYQDLYNSSGSKRIT